MAVKVKEIAALMEEWASKSLAEPWDNPGLNVGRPEAEVTRVITALDATEEVIAEAKAEGAQMIVTHHPLVFKAENQITDMTRLGSRLMSLIEAGIAHYCAHTNMDAAEGGTNDLLAELLDLTELETPENGDGILRIGKLKEPMTLASFVKRVKQVLDCPHLRVVPGKNVQENPDTMLVRVGICTGAGGGDIEIARALGADVFVTGDVRYHDAETASVYDMSIVDAGHFATEYLIADRITEYLSEKLSGCGVEVITSKSMRDPFIFA